MSFPPITLLGDQRRLVHVLVTPECLLQLFCSGTSIRVTKNGLPPDVLYILIGYDIHRDMIVFILEHESFDPVPCGNHIPQWEPTEFEVVNHDD